MMPINLTGLCLGLTYDPVRVTRSAKIAVLKTNFSILNAMHFTPRRGGSGAHLSTFTFHFYGCVTPAKITRSAKVKLPAVADGSIGVNPPETFKYELASRFNILTNVSATIFAPTGPS